MSTPTFLINSYINDYTGDCDLLCKSLFKEGILTKQLNDDDLVLIYNKFDDHQMSDLKLECRSLILDKKTFKMKAYSCETPNLILDDKTLLTLSPSIINMCYEGTLLSVFNHNDKWYVSTRRCLNSSESIFNSTELSVPKSHYTMFEEVLSKTEYNNFDTFSKSLDPTKSYYFVLIHHENKHLIDYSYKFDSDYTYLCLVSMRDSDMKELDIYEGNQSFICQHIFLPEKYDTLDSFISINERNKYDLNLQDEGIIIKVFSGETNKYKIYKYQTDSYKFAMAMGNDKNMYKGLIYLYQNNKLVNYFDQNPSSNMIKIINPLNTYESFYTTGIIDSVFKVCTSELFELFKLVISLKTGKSQNKGLYDLLSKEYKDMIYGIRGLYYKKKASLFENKNDKTPEELKNGRLSINDIYNYLKKLHVDVIFDFLKARKLMFNLANHDKTRPEMIDFGKVSSLCNKIHLKQCAIITNKLFPSITNLDFPETKK